MRVLRSLRFGFFLILLLLAAGGVAYLVNTSQQAQNGQATAVAERQTANAERDAANANLEQLRQQQQEAMGQPTDTPVVITVQPAVVTQIVKLASDEYSYNYTVTSEASPSKARIRYSVVVPPGTRAENLALRLEGGQDQPIGLSATTIDVTPGSYITANIVKKTDAGNGPVLGSTGQFQVLADSTNVIVFTFVPKENPPTP